MKISIKTIFAAAPKKLIELFGLDLRSLAAFRIAAAVCLIGDFYMRLQDVIVYYSDFGTFPRAIQLTNFAGEWGVSLHWLSGKWEVQAFLFGLSIVLALMLMAGFKTRIAAFFSWLLLVSVHVRNPMILQGGDVLFRVVLFWALFLPLNAEYSVDAALTEHKNKSRGVLSAGTIAYIFQICFLYWFTAAVKMQGASKSVWWDQSMAVYNVLNLEQFVRPLGQALALAPLPVLKFLNRLVILFEIGGPFLFFIPVKTAFFRTAGCLAVIALHLCFFSCMVIGPFTYIGSMSVIALLPGAFWDQLEKWFWPQGRGHLNVYYDGDCGFCKRTVLLLKAFCFLPDHVIHKAQDHPPALLIMQRENTWVVFDAQGTPHTKFDGVLKVLAHFPLFRPVAWALGLWPFRAVGTFLYEIVSRHRPQASEATRWLIPGSVHPELSLPGNLLALIFFVFVFFWNLGTVNHRYAVPYKYQGYGIMLGLDQYWNMFSPPLTDDGWYVIPGKLRSGKEVDVYRGGSSPVDWNKPETVYQFYKNTRWRKYLMNLWSAGNANYRLYYGQYLCRDWNAHHQVNELLDEFEIFFVREMTRPNQTAKAEKVSIWKHYCFKVPNAATTPPAAAPKPPAIQGSAEPSAGTANHS